MYIKQNLKAGRCYVSKSVFNSCLAAGKVQMTNNTNAVIKKRNSIHMWMGRLKKLILYHL